MARSGAGAPGEAGRLGLGPAPVPQAQSTAAQGVSSPRPPPCRPTRPRPGWTGTARVQGWHTRPAVSSEECGHRLAWAGPWGGGQAGAAGQCCHPPGPSPGLGPAAPAPASCHVDRSPAGSGAWEGLGLWVRVILKSRFPRSHGEATGTGRGGSGSVGTPARVTGRRPPSLVLAPRCHGDRRASCRTEWDVPGGGVSGADPAPAAERGRGAPACDPHPGSCF